VARRVTELSNVQRQLSIMQARPDNYGLITSILSHMLQHTGVSAVTTDGDVVRALADVRFQEIKQRFGCFFLHNLDIEKGSLPDIEATDPPGVLWALKGKKAVPEKDPPEATNGTDQSSARFITWEVLCSSLNTKGPTGAVIKSFTWHPKFLEFSVAEELFRDFTYQFWRLTLGSAFEVLKHPPISMRQAMELWTLQSINLRIKHGVEYSLVPSSDELKGAVPEKSQPHRFGSLRLRFFPEPGTSVHPKSCWGALFKSGYVGKYHKALGGLGDAGESLKHALDGIFRNLQLLPFNPGLPSTPAPLWRNKKAVFTLLVNSVYIEVLERTIKRAEVRVRGSGNRKLMSRPQVMKMLQEGQGDPHLPKKQSQRRGRAKNWRQPPRPKQGPHCNDAVVQGTNKIDADVEDL
jgi:hypothetical protein